MRRKFWSHLEISNNIYNLLPNFAWGCITVDQNIGNKIKVSCLINCQKARWHVEKHYLDSRQQKSSTPALPHIHMELLQGRRGGMCILPFTLLRQRYLNRQPPLSQSHLCLVVSFAFSALFLICKICHPPPSCSHFLSHSEKKKKMKELWFWPAGEFNQLAPGLDDGQWWERVIYKSQERVSFFFFFFFFPHSFYWKF